ncbi:hypothetical protein FN846DRAFT_463724 [Sphaerosporella brunnea]|uniref:Uncharacterized protein n=1 Tax=Sphaerosporella brunnea TaxID=1250544 RepID=A0A5J5EG47_9PEZI|nr:hypothetical protein FN846DRAFT_463724 [Sphaerosporella brunnea]
MLTTSTRAQRHPSLLARGFVEIGVFRFMGGGGQSPTQQGCKDHAGQSKRAGLCDQRSSSIGELKIAGGTRTARKRRSTCPSSTASTFTLLYRFLIRPQTTATMKSLLLLPLLVSSVLAANFGSCLPQHQCGFICCASTELCMNNMNCMSPEYIVSAIAATKAHSIYPTLTNPAVVSSLRSAISSSSGAAESVYSEFRSVMTDAPSPSALQPTVPSGFTIPSSLNPSSVSSRVSKVMASMSRVSESRARETATASRSHSASASVTTRRVSSSSTTTASSTTTRTTSTPTSTAAAATMGVAGAAVMAAVAAALL